MSVVRRKHQLHLVAVSAAAAAATETTDSYTSITFMDRFEAAWLVYVHRRGRGVGKCGNAEKRGTGGGVKLTTGKCTHTFYSPRTER